MSLEHTALLNPPTPLPHPHAILSPPTHQGDFDVSPVLNAVVRFPRQDTLSRRSQAVTGVARVVQLDLYRAGQQVRGR